VCVNSLVTLQMYENNSDLEFLKSKISIIDYLLQNNVHPVSLKGNYALFHAPYRQDRNPSCIVYPVTNTFKDMSTGQGGDIIELVRLIHNCGFKEALDKLRTCSCSPVEQLPQRKPSELSIIEVKRIFSWPLKKYILKRGISSNTANRYCNEVAFANGNSGKQYYAIGFKNDKGGYELRNEHFKGCNGKYITTIVEKSDSKDFMIFEGFFDYLSYKELFRDNSQCNAIILNSLAMLPVALKKLHEVGANKIFACLDADCEGKKAFVKIADIYGDNAIDMSGYYGQHNFKDLNEYLMNVKKNTKKMSL